MTKVYLSLGSNIGKRKFYLEEAIRLLNGLPNVNVTKVSPYYETPAWGNTDQNDFLNLCCELETNLQAQDLLNHCQSIEKKLGRVRHEHWGPRTIDIDILLFGDALINEDNLKVPHPYMLERAFVMVPLLDIAPNLSVSGKPISEIIKSLDCSDIQKIDVASVR